MVNKESHCLYSMDQGLPQLSSSMTIHVLYSRGIEGEALLNIGDTELPLLRAQGKPVSEEPLSKTLTL